MSLIRTESGKLVRYQDSDLDYPFDLEDWDSPYHTIAIASNELRFTLSGSFRSVRHTGAGYRHQVMIHSRYRAQNAGAWWGIVVHQDSHIAGTEDQIYGRTSINRTSGEHSGIFDVNAGTQNALDNNTAATAKSTGTDYLCALFIDRDGAGYFWDENEDPTIRTGTGTPAKVEGRQGFMGAGSGFVWVSDWIASKARYLTIEGLSTGQIGAVRDGVGNDLAFATESGGVATIDLLTVDITNVGDVVVYDPTHTTIEEQTTPSDGMVYGGDTWSVVVGAEYEGDRVIVGDASWNLRVEALLVNGATYFGGVADNAEIKVAKYTHATDTLEVATPASLTSTDDHGSPKIVIDSTGFIYISYGEHAVETSAHWRKSTGAYDITGWSAENTVTFSDSITYPTIFKASDGRLTMIARLNNGLNRNQWAMRTSTDDGSSWSTERIWLQTTDTWVYPWWGIDPADPDTVVVLFGFHSTESSNHDLYMGILDIKTGDITAPGGVTSLANIYDGTGLPFDPTTDGALLIRSPAAGRTIASQIPNHLQEVAWLEWPTADDTDVDLNWVEVSGGVVGTVRTIKKAGQHVGAGMASTGAEQGIVLSTTHDNGSPRTYVLERHRTTDGGASWATEQLDDGLQPELLKFRPVNPLNSTYVIWAQGIYPSYTAFDTDIILYEAPSVSAPPTTPTISVDAVRDDSVDLSGSTFSDPDGDTHVASQWQIDLESGDFSSPVFDSGEDAVNLTSIEGTGLTVSTSYKARVRYKDSGGEWSEWSTAETFFTGIWIEEPDEPSGIWIEEPADPATTWTEGS